VDKVLDGIIEKIEDPDTFREKNQSKFFASECDFIE
jgi:hypothetical protein